MDQVKRQLELSQTQLKYVDRDYLIREHVALLPDGKLTTNEEKLTPPQDGLARFQDMAEDLKPNNQVDILQLLDQPSEPLYGKFLLCRTIVSPVKILALSTVVEDPAGQYAARVAIHNIGKTIGTVVSVEMARSLFRVGTILAIKDPWLKQIHDGGLSIRCDNPSNLIVLDENILPKILPNVAWKGSIPTE